MAECLQRRNAPVNSATMERLTSKSGPFVVGRPGALAFRGLQWPYGGGGLVERLHEVHVPQLGMAPGSAEASPRRESSPKK